MLTLFFHQVSRSGRHWAQVLSIGSSDEVFCRKCVRAPVRLVLAGAGAGSKSCWTNHGSLDFSASNSFANTHYFLVIWQSTSGMTWLGNWRENMQIGQQYLSYCHVLYVSILRVCWGVGTLFMTISPMDSASFGTLMSCQHGGWTALLRPLPDCCHPSGWTSSLRTARHQGSAGALQMRGHQWYNSYINHMV